MKEAIALIFLYSHDIYSETGLHGLYRRAVRCYSNYYAESKVLPQNQHCTVRQFFHPKRTFSVTYESDSS